MDNQKDMQVFINYVEEDREIALKLYNDLKNKDITAWINTVNLLGGQNWRNTINHAIKESSYFIALLSSNSISKKGYIQKELKIALEILELYPENEIFLIPIRLDNCQPINEKLEQLHRIDLFPSYDDGFKKLLRVLQPYTENDKEIDFNYVKPKIDTDYYLSDFKYKQFVRAVLVNKLNVPSYKIKNGIIGQMDLIYTEETELAEYTTIIDCKYCDGTLIDQDEIYKLLGIKSNIQASKAMYVTNFGFTKNAKDVAKKEKIALLTLAPQLSDFTENERKETDIGIDELFEIFLSKVRLTPSICNMTVVHKLLPDPNDRGLDIVGTLLADPNVRNEVEKIVKDPQFRNTAESVIRNNPDLARTAFDMFNKWSR